MNTNLTRRDQYRQAAQEAGVRMLCSSLGITDRQAREFLEVQQTVFVGPAQIEAARHRYRHDDDLHPPGQ